MGNSPLTQRMDPFKCKSALPSFGNADYTYSSSMDEISEIAVGNTYTALRSCSFVNLS